MRHLCFMNSAEDALSVFGLLEPLQIGLEFLVDHSGNDPTKWSVVQIFYNGQVFANTTELNTAFLDTTSGLNRQQVSSFASITSLTSPMMYMIKCMIFA